MTADNKPSKPVSPEESELWELPLMEAETSGDTNALGMAADWYQTEPEPEPEEEEHIPLTLKEIEAVRQSAYEDGFNEGKENGFNQGLEEGKLEGLSQGHEAGLSQGKEEGLAAGKDVIDQHSAQWSALTEQLNSPLSKLNHNIEHQLVQLALSLAEQIVRCEVKTNPQLILNALKQAVEVLPIANQQVSILLQPDDLELVKQSFDDEECEKRGWTLCAEPSLNRGDCQVKTETSSVDYPLDARINQVIRQFLASNSEHMPAPSDD